MSAAARQHRYRERQRRGEVSYLVTIDERTFSALSMAGLLSDNDADCRAQVGLALSRALAEWAIDKEAEIFALRVTRGRLGLPYRDGNR